jgi:hypothetical protein
VCQADGPDTACLTEQVLTLKGQLGSLEQQCVSLHRQTEQDSKIIAAANEELEMSKAWFHTSNEQFAVPPPRSASKN